MPDSGAASARPAWPGAARPAGWFLSPASGEAAPPEITGQEPARADAAQPPQADWADGGDVAAPYAVADSGPDDGWYEDPQPTAVHQLPPSWSWRREPPQSTPAETGAWQEMWQDEPAGEPASPGYEMPLRQPRFVPVVGPTAARRGRAGGPGFIVPPGAVSGLYDPERRSAWQLAAGVWAESGVSWQPESGWGEYQPHSQSWFDDDYAADDEPPRDGHSFAWTPAFSSAPAFAGAASFAGAPTFADAPAPTAAQTAAPPLPDQWRDDEPQDAALAEPDELYRAWQGSVREAVADPGRPRLTPAARHRAWQIVRVGVPAAVLVTVGAGALMMLTGKTNEMLASRGDQTAPPAADVPAAFAGYPGQHGTVTVNSIAAAGGVQLAVGAADGHPAIWRRAASGSWTLISASSPAIARRPGMDSLLSVAHGPAGWIAIGAADANGGQQPVVLTSADGAAWQPADSAVFTAPGVSVAAVTASARGYVVVGRQMSNGRTFAAMWFSGDLRNWAGGSNGGLDGRLESSAVYAVGATATGFVAAGTHGGGHTIWTSADGKTWTVYDVPMPPGVSGALLQQVAVNGSRVVTAGYVTGKAGDAPIVVVSADGGWHWQQILLSAPGGVGTVTTLTAAGRGFVAAGLAGPAGAQHAVTWSSPDGISWSAATPVSAGQITALSAVGAVVSGTAQRGAEPSVVTLNAP